MGRILVLFGLIFVIVSVTIMLIAQSLETYEFSRNVIADVLCEPGEQVTYEIREVRQSRQNYTTLYFCENNEGRKRQINEQLRLVTTVGFLVPFFIGMPMIMMGVWLVRRARYSKMTRNFGAHNLLGRSNINFSQSNISPAQQAQIGQILQSISNASMSSEDTSTLADRLRQLEDAYKQGLITDVEYQHARQAILDHPNDKL